jgi:hypothetical protein
VALPFFRRRKVNRTKILDSKCVLIKKKKEEGEFHAIFGSLKYNRQEFFTYFKMGISKFENFKKTIIRRIHN